MNAVGCCFVFIISLIGKISAFDISLEEELQFYLKVLEIHNKYRETINLLPLVFGLDANVEAKRLLDKFVNEGVVDISTDHGVNECIIDLSTITTLDNVAENLVENWYKNFNENNYSIGSSNNNTEAFPQFLVEDTTKLGVSMKQNNNKLYVIVTYFPKAT